MAQTGAEGFGDLADLVELVDEQAAVGQLHLAASLRREPGLAHRCEQTGWISTGAVENG